MIGKRSVSPAEPDMDDYRAKDDARTLMSAEEIKADKARHEKAQGHVRKQFHTAARAMAKKGKGNRFTARAKLTEK